MSRSWKSYRHRFVPWLALNWSTRQVMKTNSKADSAKERIALQQLHSLLQQLNHVIPITNAREWTTLLHDREKASGVADRASQVMESWSGFSLGLRDSVLPGGGGGTGVFVARGTVPKDHVVGLYPGTIYLPFEPLLLQSVRNPFIFRCVDGYMIDGKHKGLSKKIYMSCANRDVIGHSLSCDVSWLSTNRINPLAVGQFVNNHTRDTAPNVEYIEVSIPDNFPAVFRRFIPNVFYSHIHTDNTRLMRIVALMSTRPIKQDEELYSSYLTTVVVAD